MSSRCSVGGGGFRCYYVIVELLLVAVLASTTLARLRTLYDHYDPLTVAKCEVRCTTASADRVTQKSLCIKECITKGDSKPGTCPPENTTLSPFAAACLEECQFDTQCSGTAKCCMHSCGVTCQPAMALNLVPDLPDIPTDLKIVERRKKRAISIEWTPGQQHQQQKNNFTYFHENAGVGKVIYLIEERHHTGKHFMVKRLSEWMPCSKATKPSHNLRQCVKSGRWYQFRVAAVNGKGSKGYSNSSLPYSYSINPKPPEAPPNMTVGPLLYKNGTLHVQLMWSHPSSDLPIQKYKVFWSKRLHGAAKALDSVLVHQHAVPRDQTFFLIHNLETNSQYFLQVQALVQYGRERFKGEKSGLVLNTTDYINGSDHNALVLEESLTKTRLDGVRLQKLFWHRGILKARIVWKARNKFMKYSVSWWTGPCRAMSKGYHHPKYSAITKVPHFDLKDLQFDCKYKVSIREITEDGLKATQDTSITFITPKCQKFRSRNKKHLNC